MVRDHVRRDGRTRSCWWSSEASRRSSRTRRDSDDCERDSGSAPEGSRHRLGREGLRIHFSARPAKLLAAAAWGLPLDLVVLILHGACPDDWLGLLRGGTSCGSEQGEIGGREYRIGAFLRMGIWIGSARKRGSGGKLNPIIDRSTEPGPQFRPFG